MQFISYRDHSLYLLAKASFKRHCPTFDFAKLQLLTSPNDDTPPTTQQSPFLLARNLVNYKPEYIRDTNYISFRPLCAPLTPSHLHNAHHNPAARARGAATTSSSVRGVRFRLRLWRRRCPRRRLHGRLETRSHELRRRHGRDLDARQRHHNQPPMDAVCSPSPLYPSVTSLTPDSLAATARTSTPEPPTSHRRWPAPSQRPTSSYRCVRCAPATRLRSVTW